MPKGEPRSVPDPAGEQYDEMIRQEQSKKQLAQSAVAKPPLPLNEAYFSPFARRVDTLDLTPRRGSTFRIGKKTYREIDNGRANVLVEVDDPQVSPSERAERRRAITRALFIADHPLSGVAYGLAALANRSQKTRDAALMAGGLADAAMLGAAPFGAAARGRIKPPGAELVPLPLPRDKLRYRDPNANGQAMAAAATLMAPLGRGSKPDRKLHPPGWQGNGKVFNEARGHLIAKQFGGSGEIMENLVTQTHRGSNTPQMSGFENQIAKRVRGGEVIEYSATPLYNAGVLPPASILLTAHGSRGAPTARIIKNPAGRRK